MAKALLTRTAVIAAFGVTGLTILNWRKGTATRDPLPAEVTTSDGGRPTVMFVEADVTKWAKKYGLPFNLKAPVAAATQSTKEAAVAKKVVPAKKASKTAPVPTKRAKASSSALAH